MAGGERLQITESRPPLQELEPLPRYPILLLGAGNGTGRELALRFACEGYPVIVGTRSEEKFTSLATEIHEQGGIPPRPFIADNTNPEQVAAAYEGLQIKEGMPMHVFPIAAGGLEKMKRPVLGLMIPLRRAFRDGLLTKALLDETTEKIKHVVLQEEIQRPAKEVNYTATLALLTLMIQKGHIRHGSRVVTLSSTGSDTYDVDNPDAYPGPWFYLPIAKSKAEAVVAMRRELEKTAAVFLNVIAPEIEGTDVGNLMEQLVPMIEPIYGNRVVIPSVTKEQTVEGIWQLVQWKLQKGSNRNIYLTSDGLTTIQPEEFKQPLIPYL